MEYICPYCYSDKTTRNKKFTSWRHVNGHTGFCNKNDGRFYISTIFGPIDYVDIATLSMQELTKLYNKNTAIDIRRKLREFTDSSTTDTEWDKASCIVAIRQFIEKYSYTYTRSKQSI